MTRVWATLVRFCGLHGLHVADRLVHLAHARVHVLSRALNRVLDVLDVQGLADVEAREVDGAVQQHERDHVQHLVPFGDVQPLLVIAEELCAGLEVVEPLVPARAGGLRATTPHRPVLAAQWGGGGHCRDVWPMSGWAGVGGGRRM